MKNQGRAIPNRLMLDKDVFRFSPFVINFIPQRLVGATAQSIERATPGEEVLSSIPAVAARSLLAGSVSV